jgi:hypothetical protein
VLPPDFASTIEMTRPDTLVASAPTTVSAGTLRDKAQGRTIASETLVSGLKAGKAVKRASKRKRRSKTIPALGAAGLSLTLTSEASLATVPALDTMTHKAGVSHEMILREDEIFDVSLATFYVFDKERAGAFRASGRLIKVTGCCEFACLAGQAASENSTYSSGVPYSAPMQRPIRPAHKPVRKKR